MKKIIFINCSLISFMIGQALAVEVQYSGPFDHNILEIKNQTNSTEIYISNYKKQKFLVYKSSFRYEDRDSVGTLADTPDLIAIGFSCGRKASDLDFCMRFFNRRTN